MTLPNEKRRETWAGLMRSLSRVGEETNLTKPDLRAAVDATDQWIEDNAASFNAALPEPFKSNATAQQKVRVFAAVAKKRWEVA